MSIEGDDNDLFGNSVKALGEFDASLGGSVITLQETYRNYGNRIIAEGLFGGFLVPFLDNKPKFMETLAKIDITHEFHQEMIFRRFKIEKEKRDTMVVAATSSAASEKKTSMPHDRPPNEIKRGRGRPPKKKLSCEENNNDENDDEEHGDHVDSSMSSVSSSHDKQDEPKKKRRRMMNKENVEEEEIECQAIGGGASSGMAISGTIPRHKGHSYAVECLDLETGAVIKRYPMLKDAAIAMGCNAKNTSAIRKCIKKKDGKIEAHGYGWRKVKDGDGDDDDDDDDDHDDELGVNDSRPSSSSVGKVTNDQIIGSISSSSRPKKLALQNKPSAPRPSEPFVARAIVIGRDDNVCGSSGSGSSFLGGIVPVLSTSTPSVKVVKPTVEYRFDRVVEQYNSKSKSNKPKLMRTDKSIDLLGLPWKPIEKRLERHVNEEEDL